MHACYTTDERVPCSTNSFSVKNGDKLCKLCFILQSVMSSLQGKVKYICHKKDNNSKWSLLETFCTFAYLPPDFIS